MPGKCPWCGAKRCEVEPLTHVYLCGSSETLRHADCYEREIKRLRDKLMECVVHFKCYEMDVDDEPPNHHRQFIMRLQKVINA